MATNKTTKSTMAENKMAEIKMTTEEMYQLCLKKNLNEYDNCELMLEILKKFEVKGKEQVRKAKELYTLAMKATNVAARCKDVKQGYRWYELAHKFAIWSASEDFDMYMLACEWNREPSARFWLPRRAVLEGKHRVATQIQEFLDDKDALYLSMSFPPGTGKAQPLYSKILTPTGFTTMGELEVGQIIIGGTGTPCKVTGIYPQGKRKNYRVWFSDGTSADCSDNHLWTVQTREDRQSGKYRTIELSEMLSRGIYETDGHKKYSIDYVKPVEFEKRKLLIHPYVLGVLIGGGSLTNGARFTNAENEKSIPQDYLLSSVEDRLELLRGLLDTDGYVMSNNVEYTTTSSKLKDDMMFLVSSLGGYATYTEKQGSYRDKCGNRVETRKYYRMYLRFSENLIPVSSKKAISKYGNKKRNVLRKFIAKIEYIGYQECQCIMVDDPTHLYITDDFILTHNTTLLKFLLAYVVGKNPKSSNMYISYSDGMVKMMYDSENSILTDTSEYAHNDIFMNGSPTMSAEYNTISYRKKGDFPTLGIISLGGSVTGRTRANYLMVTDDLVKNAEMARNMQRLETLYEDYRDTITTRQIGDNVKQIMLGTIWSLHDPISRIKSEHEGDNRYRFIAIPVVDEEGHSNFEYDCVDRYTDEKISEIRKNIDEVTFACLYMQQPIEREGLLFKRDEFNWYNGKLPEGGLRRVVAACDVAWGGGDSLSMPFAYEYEDGSVYIHDVVFNSKDKKVTMPIVVAKSIIHNPSQERYEANNGGSEYAAEIDRQLIERGVHINIGHKRAPTNKSKVERIVRYAPDIKRIYLRDDKGRGQEYDNFVSELFKFNQNGKNPHDDAPDSLAQLMDLLYHGGTRIEIMKRII